MGINELIERYCEETNILEDKNNLVVFFYGSRTTNHFTNSSDLDVFVITEVGKTIKKSQLIDGIHTETTFISNENLKKDIVRQMNNFNFYYESIFNTGIVRKDSDYLAEAYKLSVEDYKKQVFSCDWLKSNGKLSSVAIERIYPVLVKYKGANSDSKKLYYYELLGWIRSAYELMYNLPSIHFLKVYDLYSNPVYAQEQYKMELPSVEFRSLFLNAICSSENMDESLKLLFNMIGYKWDYNYNIEEKVEEKQNIKMKNEVEILNRLVHLNHWVYKVEDMLLKNSLDKEYCYFILLGVLRENYPMLCGEDIDAFNLKIEQAINATDVQERIDVLEELLHLMDYQYDLDYDDFTL